MVKRRPGAHALELFDADHDLFSANVVGEVWDDRRGHGWFSELARRLACAAKQWFDLVDA